jgi:hypothetical protein
VRRAVRSLETIARIRPRYITAIRSASPTTSSSSLDTTSTAVPLSRSATIRLWMNSIDPTSTPRVGWAATNNRSGRDISRATTTFCWLPPDSVLTADSAEDTRMSNCSTRSRADAAIAAGLSRNALPYGSRSYMSRTRFSATENSRITPSRLRSSGTYPIAERRIRLVDMPIRFSLSTVIDPACGTRRPITASTSSVCPLPCTPATPSTSPACTSRSMPSTARMPRSSSTTRPEIFSTVRPGSAGVLVTSRLTSRPTISAASSSSLVSGVATPTVRPRRITVIRSAMALTSRSLCVMKTIDLPVSASPRMTVSSSSVSCGVSTAVGSSRMSSSTSRVSAFTISTRCCAPTGRFSTSASGSTGSPYRRETSMTSRRARLRSSAPSRPPRVFSAPSAMFSATVKTGTSMKCW